MLQTFIFYAFKDHNTPLYFAIKTKNIEIVRLLLSHPNIDVNIKNIINIFF